MLISAAPTSSPTTAAVPATVLIDLAVQQQLLSEFQERFSSPMQFCIVDAKLRLHGAQQDIVSYCEGFLMPPTTKIAARCESLTGIARSFNVNHTTIMLIVAAAERVGHRGPSR
jgi:hypothetical protein